MSNVAHSTLTGANLHEPKGVASAITGTVYVADGAGTGSWTTIPGAATPGQIADFYTPVAPTGWLELDGSDISRTTYSALFAAETISQTGTTSNGSAVVTTLASTTNLRVGYYVYGTGITAGTTITVINSSTQITMSANATASGSVTVYASPCRIDATTFRLPDVTTGGRYRRSRTSSAAVGALQATQNLAHDHGGTATGSLTISGTATDTGGGHTHAFSWSGTTTGETGLHHHTLTDTNYYYTYPNLTTTAVAAGGISVLTGIGNPVLTDATDTGRITGDQSANHTHGYSGNSNTGQMDTLHTFTVGGSTSGSLTVASSGSTEARPITLVVMTCIKY